jgi:TRAP-type C4-dicarboxylate transport system permease large subunit
MLFKIVILVLFLFVLYSLGSGLYYLTRDGQESKRMVKALTWRISISLVIFVLLLVAFALGWITPNSIMVAPSS